MEKYIAPHQVNWHWEQLLDWSLHVYALIANQSSTSPLDLLLCDFMKSSADLHNGRKGDPLPLADLGGSQHYSCLLGPFMLCTNSIITSFAGDMFSLSLLFQEISRCFSSAAIVTRPALSHFSSYLDSSKFFISPSMLTFFGDMFLTYSS